MRYVEGKELKEAEMSMDIASQVANDSTCTRARCGSVIVSKDGRIIGKGANSPPGNIEGQRRCSSQKSIYDRKVTDKTCCIHAEQRAMFDALKNNPDEIAGSKLYFIRLGSEGKPSFSGKPYCTICSKMALDLMISEFILWHEDGICAYSTDEYNTLSYEYISDEQ